MRWSVLCLCCLGSGASFALADRQLQVLEVGGRVPALKAAQLGPDGIITEWVDVGHGTRGGERQLIFDCYEPDVDNCTGYGFWMPIGFRSCGMGEPEDCDLTGSPDGSSRWFYGADFNNMYTTNDMEFDPNYGGVEAKDIYPALYWYVNGTGSSENAALLIETYEEFDETCEVGDPGEPGFDNDTTDPGYIDGLLVLFGEVDSTAGAGYATFCIEDLPEDVRLQLPLDGAGSYNWWILTYTGDDPTWPDDFSIATSAQPMLWGTGDSECPEPDTVNRGESCTEHETMWVEGSGLPDYHEANSDDCQNKAVGVCPEPLGAMICFCIEAESPWDPDGDGDWDQSDLGILLAAWCSHQGDPDWNERADLDADGHVGHGDLGILLANWSCGP
jgi:hypothetical protein